MAADLSEAKWLERASRLNRDLEYRDGLVGPPLSTARFVNRIGEHVRMAGDADADQLWLRLDYWHYAPPLRLVEENQ